MSESSKWPFSKSFPQKYYETDQVPSDCWRDYYCICL